MLTQQFAFTKDAYDLLLKTSQSEGATLSLVCDDDNNMFVKIHNTGQYFYLDRVDTKRFDQRDFIADIDQTDCSLDKSLRKNSLTMKTDDRKGNYFPNNGQDDLMEENNRYVRKSSVKREPNF